MLRNRETQKKRNNETDGQRVRERQRDKKSKRQRDKKSKRQDTKKQRNNWFTSTMRRTATRRISLNPLQSSLTTRLMCGTRMKILRGRKHLSSIKNWAGEFGSTSFGIQQIQTRLTKKMEMSRIPLTSRIRAKLLKLDCWLTSMFELE